MKKALSKTIQYQLLVLYLKLKDFSIAVFVCIITFPLLRELLKLLFSNKGIPKKYYYYNLSESEQSIIYRFIYEKVCVLEGYMLGDLGFTKDNEVTYEKVDPFVLKTLVIKGILKHTTVKHPFGAGTDEYYTIDGDLLYLYVKQERVYYKKRKKEMKKHELRFKRKIKKNEKRYNKENPYDNELPF